MVPMTALEPYMVVMEVVDLGMFVMVEVVALTADVAMLVGVITADGTMGDKISCR